MKNKRSIRSLLNRHHYMLTLCLAMLCAMCWGCGSSDTDPVNTGVFIDGEIEGLKYESGHRSGLTDKNGKFYYAENDTIVFSIGDLILGDAAAAAALMSPIDLVNEPDAFVTHPTVTNICRLLISLDVNGDPGDGILISDAIHDVIRTLVANGLDIRFDLSTDDFSNQTGISTLFDALNAEEGIFTTEGDRTLADAETAWIHFYGTLADYNITPAVMINLGDGLTNGAQSGFSNVNEYTQQAGFAAYISYQIDAASDLVWYNPVLEITDEERNFTRVLDDDDEALTPYNLGVAGATAQSLINETTGSGNALLDELMRPITTEDIPDDIDPEHKVTQLNAALYVAKVLNPGREKIFTLWIGAEESLGAAFHNGGADLTEAAISAYLDDAASGHDLASVSANLDAIVDSLSEVPYAYVFVANIPYVDTLGCFFGKSDIEALAVFDNPDVTSLGENELIGFDPFIGDISQVETSVSRALNSDNAALNAAITLVLGEDANFLSQTEIGLINDRVDAINAEIEALAAAHDNVVLVDLNAYYQGLKENGIAVGESVLERTYGGGFFSLDGYHPSYSGNADIANQFIMAINTVKIGDTEGIGFAIDELDIEEMVLPVDPYNADDDDDGFFASPGSITTNYVIVAPIYDPELKSWIDCDDADESVFPENVDGDECITY